MLVTITTAAFGFILGYGIRQKEPLLMVVSMIGLLNELMRAAG